ERCAPAGGLAAAARRARHRRDALHRRPRRRLQHGGRDRVARRTRCRRPRRRRRGPRGAGDRALHVRDHPGAGHARPAPPRGRSGVDGRLERLGDVRLPPGGGAHDGHLRRQRGRQAPPRARPARAGGRRGDRRRLPRQPALPRGRDHRRDGAGVGRRARRRAGHPGDPPRPRRQRARLRGARREGRPARHQLLHRVDGVARPRAHGGVKGLRSRLGLRAARGGGRGRPRDRGRSQRHRDARVGRPGRRHGPGPARGAGSGRRRHRPRPGRRGCPRAGPLVPRAV
ncbi:MAG: HAD-superfamily hydrolase, subfamily IIB, partial [uncultured Nocardioidaceae bacterium]